MAAKAATTTTTKTTKTKTTPIKKRVTHDDVFKLFSCMHATWQKKSHCDDLKRSKKEEMKIKKNNALEITMMYVTCLSHQIAPLFVCKILKIGYAFGAFGVHIRIIYHPILIIFHESEIIIFWPWHMENNVTQYQCCSKWIAFDANRQQHCFDKFNRHFFSLLPPSRCVRVCLRVYLFLPRAYCFW